MLPASDNDVSSPGAPTIMLVPMISTAAPNLSPAFNSSSGSSGSTLGSLNCCAKA